MDKQTATFAAFARILGCKRAYVSELHKADRLVLDSKGRVLVAESRARIAATRDPAKAGVAARHAAARAPAASAPPVEAPAQQATEDGAEDIIPTPGDQGFQYWRQRSEKAKALAAERENAQAEGKLMDAGEVAGAVASAITTLRARLESLPDVLGPQLAAVEDESRCRGMLAEAIEHALEECARQFSGIAKVDAHA